MKNIVVLPSSRLVSTPSQAAVGVRGWQPHGLAHPATILLIRPVLRDAAGSHFSDAFFAFHSLLIWVPCPYCQIINWIKNSGIETCPLLFDERVKREKVPVWACSLRPWDTYCNYWEQEASKSSKWQSRTYARTETCCPVTQRILSHEHDVQKVPILSRAIYLAAKSEQGIL